MVPCAWPTRFKNVRRETVYYVWWDGRNEVAFLLWHSVTAGHAAHPSICTHIVKKDMIWSYTSWRQFSVSATKEDGFYAHLLRVNLHAYAQLGCYVLRLIPEMFFRALHRSWNPVCQLNIPYDLITCTRLTFSCMQFRHDRDCRERDLETTVA